MARVIIFPTDTVYGIGTKIFDIEGIEKIYKIKNRPYNKPLACLCYDINQINSIAYINDSAIKLINKFLPGPLTLILNAKEEVTNKIGYKTIGIRIPNHKLALEILKENGPMLTTSVNDSGKKPLNEYEEIAQKYNNIVDKIYYSSEESSNLSSTVVSIIDDVKILRIGSITEEEINKVLNE